MRSFSIVFYLFIAVFILSSCKSTRKVVEAPSSLVKLRGAEVIQIFDSVRAREFTFDYLSAKAEVNYTDRSGDTKGFDINLRIRKDSAIWISITPLLGIEALRALIRPDSVIILDRINKEVIKRDFVYLEEWLNTKLSYDMVQAVILGNYFQYQEKEKLKSLYQDDPFVILSTLNKRQARRAAEEKDPTKPVVQDFWIDGNYRIARSRITDDKKDRWVEANYKNFVDINGSLFPTEIVVTVAASTPKIIKVEYKKAEREETLTMPFSVPDKYEAR